MQIPQWSRCFGSPACSPPPGQGTSWGRSGWPGRTPGSAGPPPPVGPQVGWDRTNTMRNIPLKSPFGPGNEALEGRVVCLTSLTINPQLNTLGPFESTAPTVFCGFNWPITNSGAAILWQDTRNPYLGFRSGDCLTSNENPLFISFQNIPNDLPRMLCDHRDASKGLRHNLVFLERKLTSGSTTMENKIVGSSLEYWINTIITTSESKVFGRFSHWTEGVKVLPM